MKAKLKAKELVNTYYNNYFKKNGHPKFDNMLKAKDCALIAVDLRIESYAMPPTGAIEWAETKESYWSEVRTEIKNYHPF
jgi:hypothetical protein